MVSMDFDLAAFHRQAMWRTFVAAISVQLIGCGLIAYVWGDDGEKWSFFFLIVAALFVVGAINGIFGFIAKLSLGFWNNSAAYEALFLDDLRKLVPPPGSHHRRTWSYLADIADDDEYTPDQRVAAARLFADARHMMKAMPFSQQLQCEKAFDAAVQRYAEERPAPK